MHPTRPPEQRSPREAGFTLIEAIVTMTVLAIVGGMIAVFLRTPIDAYTDTARRADLTDTADTALRRFDREIRTALPNSIRSAASGGVLYLEFLQTTGAGRYRIAATSPGVGNPLDFTAADTSFDILGSIPSVPGGAFLVVMNLGAGSGADAYAGDNRSTIASLSGSTLSFASFLFPVDSPAHRFFVVDTPVTYACNPAAGTLTRISGYTIAASQPTPPASGTVTLVADKVSACNFTYDAIASRTGMVSAFLTLTSGGESVRLFRQVAVSNAP